MPKAKKILAWHFTNGMVLLDGTPLVVGKTYRHNGKVKLCESGYHASRKLFDALRYAPGTHLSRVECWGDVKEEGDKLVARNCRVLWTIDATMILHEFACRVAEQILAKVGNPDHRSLAAIDAKRKWMRGEITDDELDAARFAAWSAAGSAVWSAERSAAESAAWSAERDAAWDAALSATWSAALSAAWDAARLAAWDAARLAAWSAARLAAWSAAWSAAQSDFNVQLEVMVNEAQEAQESKE